MARLGHNKPFAYNRKEAKDHGEGGTLVGAKVQGRVLIIDDVISAGTSVRESIAMIRSCWRHTVWRVDCAGPPGKGGRKTAWTKPWSAVQYVTEQLQLPVSLDCGTG